MLPGLVLIGLGSRHRVWIPIPLILFWPFWLVGWVLWVLVAALGASWHRPLREALVMGYHLSGFKMDIKSADGQGIYVRMF